MTLQIAARLKPFCHRPGAVCIVPFTSCQVQAFPTRLRFVDLLSGKSWEERLDWKGPVEGFTVELDLERGCVALFGRTAEGFRRVWIEGTEVRYKQPAVKSGDLERLSLGKHTKLDWDLVWRRMNLEEIVPILFRLGQLVPQSEAASPIFRFLEFSDKRKIASQLICFLKAGFHGILAPRLEDEEFQGIVETGVSRGSPLALLTEGYRVLRGLFFQEREGAFSLLPTLPPEFHAGRLVHLRSLQGDLLSFEWSKKVLRRAFLKPAVSREIFLCLQPSLQSYRINKKVRQNVEKPLLLEEGQTIFLDRFEK